MSMYFEAVMLQWCAQCMTQHLMCKACAPGTRVRTARSQCSRKLYMRCNQPLLFGARHANAQIVPQGLQIN